MGSTWRGSRWHASPAEGQGRATIGLFRARPPIDRDELDWQFAAWQWLLEEFGGPEAIARTPLVLPTVDWFPRSTAQGHERALELFGQVRAAAGMTQWKCRLQPGETGRPTEVGTALHVRHEGRHPPAGTFGAPGGASEPIVTYDPQLLSDPSALVATFAHELAHYLLATARTPPPGGHALEELATDVAAVFMGFGVFLLNSAMSFSQYQNFDSQGWHVRRQGYLSERALATALAIFLVLSGGDGKAAAFRLKPYLASDLARAQRFLARAHPQLANDIAALDRSMFGGDEAPL